MLKSCLDGLKSLNSKQNMAEIGQQQERLQSGLLTCNEQDVLGRYQKRLCVLIFLSTIPNAFTTFQFLVIHYTPEFRCNYTIPQPISAAAQNNTGQVNNLTSTDVCIYLQSPAESANISELSGEIEINGSVQVPCHNLIFDGNDVTAVTEFGIVCDKAWQKPTSTSAFMMGKLFGGLFGGAVSDRFGRKTTFLLFSAWQYSTTLVLSFTSDVTVYTVLMFLCGCGGLVNYVAAILLGTELVPKTWRSFVMVAAEAGFGVGCVFISLLAFLIHDWRWYLRYTSLLGLLYVPYIWLLDESPRWLMASRKSEHARNVLQKIAKANGLESSEDIGTEMASFTATTEKSESESIWKTVGLIICNRRLLLRLVVVCYSWAITSLTYYMISLDSASWSGNRYLNMALLGFAEILATCLYYCGVQRFGRRMSYIGLISATALCVASVPFIKLWNPSFVVVAAICGRLFASATFCVKCIYTAELFPTVVRNTAVGFASACSRFGSMLAPFIIFIGHQTNGPTMSVIMAAIILLSAATFLVLPETRNAQLPQTLEDAKRMKSDVKIFTRCKEKKNHRAASVCKTSV